MMSILMLVKWLEILCLTTAFCMRSLIFGGYIVLDFPSTAKFTWLDPHVHASGSTLALYSCLFVLWSYNYCHIQCLVRHTVCTVTKISKAVKFVIMFISNLLNLFTGIIKFKPPDPHVLLYGTDSTLLQHVCFNVLWLLTKTTSYLLLHSIKCTARDLISYTTVATLTISCTDSSHL